MTPDSESINEQASDKATPKNGLKELGKKALNSDGFIATFLRSAVSSQLASWCDMGSRFLLFFVGVTPFLATSLGCVVGGIINCIVNYHFTFHASDTEPKAVALKYALVWAGSLLLNAFGTQGLYYTIKDWLWLENIGFKRDGFFMASTLIVSLLVSWCWNFPLQRYFVYKPTRFDGFFCRCVSPIVNTFAKFKKFFIHQ